MFFDARIFDIQIFTNNEILVFTLSSILYIPFRLQRIGYDGSEWFTSLWYVRKLARVNMKSCIIVWIVTTIVCWWWGTRFQWLWHCSVRKAIIYNFYRRSVLIFFKSIHWQYIECVYYLSVFKLTDDKPFLQNNKVTLNGLDSLLLLTVVECYKNCTVCHIRKF